MRRPVICERKKEEEQILHTGDTPLHFFFVADAVAATKGLLSKIFFLYPPAKLFFYFI